MVDGNTEAMQALMAVGKERGYITHDELNKALPQGELTSEQIEDFMSELNSIGVNIVDSAESDDGADDEETEKSSGNLSDDARGLMIRCECICVRWAVSNCSHAKARLPLPSESKLGENCSWAGFANHPDYPCFTTMARHDRYRRSATS